MPCSLVFGVFSKMYNNTQIDHGLSFLNHYSSSEMDKNIHKKSWLQKRTNNTPKIVEPPVVFLQEK